jgi:tetratricopeptide (TPR) repeat protein
VPDSDYLRDFFVSHADADLEWAEWVAAELETAGYGVIVKAWDFRPGENNLARHDEALATSRHTICVLSEDYADSESAVRAAAQYQHLTGKERALIPVKVAACEPPPLMAPIIAIDVSDVEDPDEAKRRLLSGVADRADRVARGGYPKSRATRVRFPGAPQDVWELRGHRADPYFIGRGDLLAEVHRGFRAGGATSAVQVITGLGGLGKTRLAVEYALRHGAAYDVVWWLRAEDPATMRGDYVELASELGLPSEQDDQAIAALRRELRRRRDWLLIFDNAEDPDELFPLLPERHSGHVLITSQRQGWPHAETRRLEVLSADVAATYLQRKGQVADAGTARDLADALGGLPLALVQAASVIADGMRAVDYLDLLRRQAPGLFAEGASHDHELTVDSTWRVSMDRLAGRSAAAVALFRLAAFLAADAIPLARLTAVPLMPAELAGALANPLQLRQATAALGEFSLAETADGLLSIHRLVQAVTRTELGDGEPHWASIALAAIAAAFPDDEQDPKSWEACEEFLAHALACISHAIRLHVETVVATVQLTNRAARYLLARGRLDSADAVLRQVSATAEQLGRDHLVYLSYRNTFGRLLLAKGDFPAARTVHEEVYQARAELLGGGDPDTLRAGRDLVEVLYNQGNWVQAAQLHDRLVEEFTAVLGPDDLETITAQAYLATILKSAGQYGRALAIEEKVVEARTRALGHDHPDTFLAQDNLVSTLVLLGELKQGRAIGEEVLEAQVRVLGEEHPHTIMSRANLAATLRQLGELERARSMEVEVLEARVRVLGEEHPHTINARANLAATLRKLGELERARSMEVEVLEARVRVLGEEHPETISTRSNLAATLYELGEFERARSMEVEVLEARVRLLGKDHPSTIEATANLAATLYELGEPERARSMEVEVLEARVRLLGEDHPDTIDARASLAVTLREQGELDQAHALGEQAVRASTQVFGQDHSRTLGAKADLAVTLFAQGNGKEALSLLNECLAAALRIFGPKHTVTTEAAWRLVEHCGPHETNKQRALIMTHLAWLGREQPGHLTGSQKKIKEGLKGSVHGSKQSASGKRQPARAKKQSAPNKNKNKNKKKRR